jgi:hypothetical protein
MKTRTTISILGASITFAIAISLHAQIPSLINYQGRLTDAQGNPVNGNRTMSIHIYDAASGGNLTYSENVGNITVTNGTYSFQFGSAGNGIIGVLSGFSDYLALSVNGSEESTRTRLLAVPYALKAKESETSSDTQNIIPEFNTIAQKMSWLLSRDPDGDGVNDYREWKDGTDSANPNSFDPLSKGLFAYYPYNGNINDESGYERHGEIVSGGFGIDHLGNANSAFEANSEEEYAKVPLASSLFNGDYTISTLVRFDNPEIHYPHIFYGENSYMAIHGLGPAYGDLKGSIGFIEYEYIDYPGRAGNIGNNRSYFLGNSKVPSGTWCHVCITRSSGVVRLFINGVLDTDSITQNLILQEGSFMQIGCGILNREWASVLDQTLFGAVDESRFYNRALSDEEVAQLYAKEFQMSNMQ